MVMFASHIRRQTKLAFHQLLWQSDLAHVKILDPSSSTRRSIAASMQPHNCTSSITNERKHTFPQKKTHAQAQSIRLSESRKRGPSLRSSESRKRGPSLRSSESRQDFMRNSSGHQSSDCSKRNKEKEELISSKHS
jgi:hypothetical protein